MPADVGLPGPANVLLHAGGVGGCIRTKGSQEMTGQCVIN